MTPVYKHTVISLIGRTSSGKSTLGKKLARYLRTAHVEVSDVILTGMDIRETSSRADLAATSAKTKEEPEWLGKAIDIAIQRKIEDKDRTVVVVSGLREIEAVNYLRNNYNFFGFEVRAEVPVRYQRSLDDRKYDNADEFIRGEIRELDLGLEEVEDDAIYAIPTSPLTNPDRIVRATVKLLRTKGAVLR